MRSRFTWTGAAALVALALALAASPAPATPLAGALSEARDRRCLVLADFATEWCLWCRRLEVLVYPDPGVSRQLERVVYVKLNAEAEGKSDAERYGVTGYPTLLILTPDGEVVGRIEGFLPARPMEQRLRSVLDSIAR